MTICPTCQTLLSLDDAGIALAPGSEEGDLTLPLTVQGDEGYVYAASWDVWVQGPVTYPTAQAAWYALAEYRDAERNKMGYRPDEDSATIRDYGDKGMVGGTEIKMHPLGRLIPLRVDRVKKGQ